MEFMLIFIGAGILLFLTQGLLPCVKIVTNGRTEVAVARRVKQRPSSSLLA